MQANDANGLNLITDLYRVIERGRTTGYIYQVTNPLLFHRAASFAYQLRETSKQGGHEVTCWFVVPETSSVLEGAF